MATTLPLPATRGATRTQGAVATRETAWRLAGATLTALATTLFLFGTAWDIQWHPAVGRDRALTSPHQFMLGGIGLAGLVALALILLDTRRARSGQGVDASNSRQMFRVFQAPVGFAVVGFGALLSTIAFPLDDYWHTLYGVDVTLWAPFHVMIIFGMVMAELGTLTVLASEMNRMAPGRGRTALQVGIAGMLAVLLATVAMFLVQADWVEGLAHLGTLSIALYPILLAFLLPVGLLSAVRVTRLPGAATLVALGFLAIRGALYAFVPWGMAWGISTEGLSYRPNPPVDILVPYAYPIMILAAALVIDAVAWLSRNARWSDAAVLGAGVFTAVGVTLLDKPWARMLKNFVYPDMDVNAVLLNALPFALVAAALGAGLAVLMSRGLRAEQQ